MQLVIKRPKQWSKLGDEKKIYLISPASGSSQEEIRKILDLVKSWEIEPVLFNSQTENKEPFLAESDEVRFAELKNALEGDESSIIATTRGGYGSARLLQRMLKLDPPNKNKILLGFSDITSLHLAFNNYWSLPSLHSPVLKQCATGEVDEQSLNQLLSVLRGEDETLTYQLKPLNDQASQIKYGSEFAPLLGGNLSLIQTSIGTPWAIPKSQAFSMLIEEIDEKAYALDRSLRHLVNAGLFENCQSLFVGDIDEKSVNNDKKHFSNVLNGLMEDLNIPIFSIPDIGHGKTNLAIPLGVAFSICD